MTQCCANKAGCFGLATAYKGMTSKSSPEGPRKDDVGELRHTTTDGAWRVTDRAETLVVKQRAGVCALNYRPQAKSTAPNAQKSEKMNL